MKTKRILAAMLATVMAVGAGTIPASASEWYLKNEKDIINYNHWDTWDAFNFYTEKATTLRYTLEDIMKWNVSVEQWGRELDVDVYGVESWAPQVNKLHTTATAFATDGTHDTDQDSNGYTAFCGSSAKVGWRKSFDHGLIQAKFDQIMFETNGSSTEKPRTIK